MINHSDYFSFLKSTDLKDLAFKLEEKVRAYYTETSHGDIDRWMKAVQSLPNIVPSRIDLSADAVSAAGDVDDVVKAQVEEYLMHLHPWRKGPFDVFGVHVDCEWRSDIKWARLAGCIDLRNKLVLDVGCGNGYYMCRMLGGGAKAVIGIDPTLLFVAQFAAINKYIQTSAAAVLPLRLEDMPAGKGNFDTVFSMGLLYHRRNPAEHLEQLLSFLKPAGQLVLETIVLDKPGKENLVPDGRYAKMRNVWNIPTVELLVDWLKGAGCDEIDVVAMEKTTDKEQRKTKWMTFESLEDFLDPDDRNKTTEGHPAPVRAVVVASAN